MTIRAECSECGKQYQMSDDKAGRKFRCRACEAVVHIPDEDEYEAPSRPRRKPASKKGRAGGRRKKSRSKKSKSGANTGLIVGMGAGGVVLVAGIVVGYFMLTGDSRELPPESSGPEPVAAGSDRKQEERPATPAEIASQEERPTAPFDVEQYLKDRSPPVDNAAPLYLIALKRIRGIQTVGKLADIAKLASGGTSPALVEQALAAAGPALKQIDKAQLKPECVFVTELTFDALLPHVQDASQVARASLLEVFLAGAKQDSAMSELAIKRTLRLSRDLQPRGPLIAQLVSIAMDRIILDGVLKFTLTDRNLTVEQCDRLLALLVEHQQASLNRYEEAMHVEYILTRQTVEDVGSGRLTAKNIKDFLGISLPKKLNIDAEGAACDRLFAAAFQDAKTPYHQFVESNRFDEELSKLAAQFKANPAGAAVLAPQLAASFPAARERVTGSEAQLAGMQMLTAVLRFKLSHGKLPDSPADAAAETTLNTVPADPFSGEPMKYVVLAGRPVVYSVGKDLKDDGGRTDWNSGRQPGDYIFTTR
jgi:hypothetical protein